ncbi:MAG: hypothetical protein HY226_06780 [Candidatus Vogelbacteria bacterium]|nr:hypothetical protein [Candidatus Vogelbacteria bacterium]
MQIKKIFSCETAVGGFFLIFLIAKVIWFLEDPFGAEPAWFSINRSRWRGEKSRAEPAGAS